MKQSVLSRTISLKGGTVSCNVEFLALEPPVLASALAQFFSVSGFNQSGMVLIFRRWAAPVSYESEKCTSSGIRTSSAGCSD
ncbi:hypothetical protein Tco_0959213 [Tanacetum coccineum]